MEGDGELQGQRLQGLLGALLADGDWMFQKGEHQKAVDSFTRALSLQPGDRSCLLGRCKCLLRMGRPGDALRDAEAALREDRSFFEGLFQKAEALYHLAEFELALVFYHRGQRLRPQVQGFRLGIQKAQEAIENSVGGLAVKLELDGDLSFLRDEEDRPGAVQTLTSGNQKKQRRPERRRTSRRLLGDEKFLQNLLSDEDLVQRRTRGGPPLRDLVQGGLSYLTACSRFWTQEEPLSLPGPRPKPRRDMSRQPVPLLLDAALAGGTAAERVKKAEAAMAAVRSWSDRNVPEKKRLLSVLHSSVGNALAELGRLETALEHHQKDLELSRQCKLPEGTSRALEHIGRVQALRRQWEQALQAWQQKVPLCRGVLERTWLLHEMGWCCVELGRYREARDFGRRSLAAARQAEDERWQLSAVLLVAQSELNLGDLESCHSHFQKALSLASCHGDAAAASAIQKVLDEIKQRLKQ